jgi:hypothetical protein
MLFNPKRPSTEKSPENTGTHVPNGHMKVPMVKGEDFSAHPQALTSSNPAFVGAKMGTHATSTSPISTPRSPNLTPSSHQNTPSTAHGYPSFKANLTIGSEKLTLQLEGVGHQWLPRVRVSVIKAPVDWVVSPAFAETLIAARTALDEAVQMHHGATRVLIGRPIDKDYELRGPLRPHSPEEWADDLLAADLAYMLVIKEAFDVACDLKRNREARWLKAHSKTWAKLLDYHFAPLYLELIQSASRYEAAVKKWEAGFDPAKAPKNIAAILVIQARIPAIYNHLEKYWAFNLPGILTKLGDAE